MLTVKARQLSQVTAQLDLFRTIHVESPYSILGCPFGGDQKSETKVARIIYVYYGRRNHDIM